MNKMILKTLRWQAFLITKSSLICPRRVSVRIFHIESKKKDFSLLSDCLLDICLSSLQYKPLVCEKCNFVLLLCVYMSVIDKKNSVGNATSLVINTYFHILWVCCLKQELVYTLNLLRSHLGFIFTEKQIS